MLADTQIARIEGVPFRLPLHTALAWGRSSRLDAAEHVLVRLHLAGGAVGTAEAPPRPTIYGETVASILGLLDHLHDALVGLDIHDQAGLQRALGGVANNHTAKGALDMAAWDARAQAAGSGLSDRLAGPQSRLRVSYILGLGEERAMLAEAQRVYGLGVRVFKVKVGRDHAADLRTIAALQAAFAGAGVDLYADSNETLDANSAPSALTAMRDAGLLYVEEPLPVRQLRARAELRRQAILPIIADDSAFTPAELARELDFDTFDILNIKPARTGFTHSLGMLASARAHGKGVMVGSQASTGLGTQHAALIASQLGVTEPSELSFFLNLHDDLLDQPLQLHGGWLDLADLRARQLDPDKLRAYRLA